MSKEDTTTFVEKFEKSNKGKDLSFVRGFDHKETNFDKSSSGNRHGMFNRTIIICIEKVWVIGGEGAQWARRC